MMAIRRPAPPRAPRVHYSQCWEDVAVARLALRIPAGGRLFAIGAAGDNVLAMLLDDPGHVLAVDLSPAQTALLELKRAAFGALSPAQMGPFLGAGRDHERLTEYERIRPSLTSTAAAFWDRQAADIGRGVLHMGRFERYLGTFRRWLLPLAPGRPTVRAMLAAADLAEQERIYRERWDSWRWRTLVRAFFSRRLLAAFGRHPAAFAHAAADDVGRHFLDRARIGLTTTPIARNPFVTYILSGGFRPPDSIPDYLRPEAIPVIAARIGRLEVRTQSMLDALSGLPDGSIDAFYLSDVFELFDVEGYDKALVEIARTGRPGARLCYWNNLVDRRRPARLADLIDTHPELAQRLHAADRAFLYSRLVVESVRPHLGPRPRVGTRPRARRRADARPGRREVIPSAG
jgi:S-adenosylmethionine-diacylglycerol 3-amino-3-carboxypropyl transferase